MSLASLYNIPESEQDFMVWSFSNQDQHRQIANAIRAKKGVNIQLFPLDPIPFFDIQGWARLHQEAHNAFTKVLGIGGVDLTDVNVKDPGELASFIRLHASEHQQAAQMLGIN